MDLGLWSEQPLGTNTCTPVTHCQLKREVKWEIQEARELAQSVKCLPPEYEDPSSTPTTHVKKSFMVIHTWNPSSGETETAESRGPRQPNQ